MTITYRPRNDMVLLRLTDKGHVRGIVMPERAAQGKEWRVEAVGPKVEGLSPGDAVAVLGNVGQELARLPEETGLYLTKECNVALVVVAGDS